MGTGIATFLLFRKKILKNLSEIIEITQKSISFPMASPRGLRSFQNPFNSQGLQYLRMDIPWIIGKQIDWFGKQSH